MTNIKVKKVRDGAIIPTYGSEDAACFDFYAVEDFEYKRGITGKYGNKIPLGVAFEIPTGYAMFIVPRSSTGLKTLLRQSNSIGIIDSDYRGEVSAIYDYHGWQERTIIKKGERIAQGYIMEVPTVEFNEVDELEETKRGEGGFGSTGA